MIIVPGEPEPQFHNSMLTTDLFKQEILYQIECGSQFYRLMQVARLRESCGVKPQGCTVSVRLPPRYAKDT